jgi:multidrug/hemolysin transport system permease protein
MGAVCKLVSRNTKLYFRDKSAVFFSLLSMLVIIMMFILFLGKTNRDIFSDYSEDAAGISWLVTSWIMAGVIVVNSVTVTLVVLGTMVKDKEEKLLDGFLVAPISRTKLVLGYLLSAWVVGMIMTVLTFVLAQAYIVFDGGELLPFISILKVIGLIALNVLSGTAMVFLIVSFIKATAAYTAVTAILGILIGFVTGVYIPVGQMPEAVQFVTKMVPATHGTALMRQVFMEEATAKLFEGESERALSAFNRSMGVTMRIGEFDVSGGLMIAVLVVSAFVFLGLSVLVMKRKG